MSKKKTTLSATVQLCDAYWKLAREPFGAQRLPSELSLDRLQRRAKHVGLPETAQNNASLSRAQKGLEGQAWAQSEMQVIGVLRGWPGARWGRRVHTGAQHKCMQGGDGRMLCTVWCSL